MVLSYRNCAHDWHPLGIVRKKPYLGAFFTLLGLVAIIDMLVMRIMQVPPSHLDEYRPLRTIDNTFASDYRPSGNESLFEVPNYNERAVVTTLFSESYLAAALILGHSLRTTQISARRVLLYLPERLSPRTICKLQTVGWELHPIGRIAPPDGGQGVFYRFVDNYSKLQIWALDKIGIKRVVYLDADMLVLRNFDELWTLPFEFAAVPDVYGNKKGFVLSFNAGMMLLRTSSAVFLDMLSKIDSDGYRHGEAEQGLLNVYFAPQVVLLPYIYNANLMIKQRSSTLWQTVERDTRVIHYTVLKPFIEQERQQAKDGIWEAEMQLWESAWHDAFISSLQNTC